VECGDISVAGMALQPPRKARNGMDSYQSLWTLVAYKPAIHVYRYSGGAKAVPVARAMPATSTRVM
jgi:hypothetical protein